MLIRREALAAVLPATSADDSRYSLHSVCVEPDGRIVATDRHVLLIAKDSNPLPDEDFPNVGPEVDGLRTSTFHGNVDGQVLIESETVKRLIAGTPKKSLIPILSCVQIGRNGSEQTATAASTDLKVPVVVTLDISENAPRFPQYARAIPTPGPHRPTVRMILAVDVLEALIKGAKASAGSSKLTPKIAFDVPIGRKDRATDKAGKPAEVASCIAVEVTDNSSYNVDLSGVVMPCRF